MAKNQDDHEPPLPHPPKRSPFDEIDWAGIAIVLIGIVVMVFLFYLFWTVTHICQESYACT